MRPDAHDLYRRRRSRNRGVGLALAAFIVLLFAVSVVKVGQGSLMQGFDHEFRASALPVEEAGQ